MEKINEEVVTRDQHAGMIMGAMNPVMSIILNIGLVLVLFVGAKRVNEGLTTPGVIMAFMSYVTIILNSILFLSRIFVMYSKASASARRISEVLNLPEDLMVEHPVGNVDSVVEKAVNEAEAKRQVQSLSCRRLSSIMYPLVMRMGTVRTVCMM